MTKFRATFYDIDNTEKRWTIDFKARGPRAARAWLNGYAAEHAFGIWHDPEAITGQNDLPIIAR